MIVSNTMKREGCVEALNFKQKRAAHNVYRVDILDMVMNVRGGLYEKTCWIDSVTFLHRDASSGRGLAFDSACLLHDWQHQLPKITQISSSVYCTAVRLRVCVYFWGLYFIVTDRVTLIIKRNWFD